MPYTRSDAIAKTTRIATLTSATCRRRAGLSSDATGTTKTRRLDDARRTVVYEEFFVYVRVFALSWSHLFSVHSYRLPRAPIGRHRAASFLDVRLVLVPEMRECGQH